MNPTWRKGTRGKNWGESYVLQRIQHIAEQDVLLSEVDDRLWLAGHADIDGLPRLAIRRSEIRWCRWRNRLFIEVIVFGNWDTAPAERRYRVDAAKASRGCM